jgi:hypothetical protein
VRGGRADQQAIWVSERASGLEEDALMIPLALGLLYLALCLLAGPERLSRAGRKKRRH